MAVKGMIFAAGLGTRLKPFTLHHPKAMARVGGKPMVERVIDKMIGIGINEIVINVHHFANEIIEHVSSLNVGDAKIYISWEKETLLDTGGGILAARKWLEDADSVLIHNADILTNIDLPKLIEVHQASGSDVTLLVGERRTSRYLYFNDETLRLEGWCDVRNGAVKPASFVPDHKTMLQRAYAGIHIFDTKIFQYLEKYKESVGDVFSVIPFYVENSRIMDIRGYVQKEDYLWLDIGKPESLEEADNLINLIEHDGKR